MKKFYVPLSLLIVLLFSGSSSNSYDEGYYYWYKKEKYPLILKDEKRFVLLDRIYARAELARLMNIDAEQLAEIKPLGISNTLIPQKLGLPDSTRYWTVITGITPQLDFPTSVIAYEAPFFYRSKWKRTGPFTFVICQAF